MIARASSSVPYKCTRQVVSGSALRRRSRGYPGEMDDMSWALLGNDRVERARIGDVERNDRSENRVVTGIFRRRY